VNRKSLIKRFEDELRQARKNFQEGKCIDWEDIDWVTPWTIAESHEEYRVSSDT